MNSTTCPRCGRSRRMQPWLSAPAGVGVQRDRLGPPTISTAPRGSHVRQTGRTTRCGLPDTAVSDRQILICGGPVMVQPLEAAHENELRLAVPSRHT